MAKIICPAHEDTTPSMEVYEDGWGFCFVCGARQKIGEPSVKTSSILPESITESVAYIRNLPIKRIRGLDLHQDDTQSYYIIWPDDKFYKRRNATGKSRYTGPKGIKPPLLIYPGSKTHLVVIEGELNCMSVKSVLKDTTLTICSPGAASQFPKFIDLYKNYSRVTLILDKDASGVAYGIQTKETLLKNKHRTDLVLCDRDYNDVLVSDGSEVLIKQFRKDVGDEV